MAKIGNWGSYLKFSTNDNRILTFTDSKRGFVPIILCFAVLADIFLLKSVKVRILLSLVLNFK